MSARKKPTRRYTGFTDEKRRRFLDALGEGLSVAAACEAAITTRRTAYNHRNADKAFAEAWDAALEAGTDKLEDEAKRRAHDGVEEPVHYQGVRVDTVRKYSDTLLIFLLKGRRPEKYRERSDVKVGGSDDGQPIRFTLIPTTGPGLNDDRPGR